MKTRLLILSDLWGAKKPAWIKVYIDKLKHQFTIEYYDSYSLAEIAVSNSQKDEIHKQFINGGIEKAAEKINTLEKEEVNVLAFSIGGVIAWKAGLKGLKINHFYAISSTRLRYESHKPDAIIKLFFGEKDSKRPKDSWYKKLHVDFKIEKDKTHEMYIERSYAEMICKELVEL